jgi:hypothetical protein
VLDANGPAFVFPTGDQGSVTVRGRRRLEVPCRLWQGSDAIVREGETRFLVPPTGGSPLERPARRAAPSRLQTAEVLALGGRELVVGEVVLFDDQLGELWLGAAGEAERAGSALHGFLAGDGGKKKAEARRQAALAWLASYGLDAGLTAGMLAAADRFWRWLSGRWGGAKVLTEVPLQARLGEPERVIAGTLDVLLETPEGLVVIDHKRGRGPGNVRERASVHAAQLAAYRLALEAAGRPVAGTWVHLVGAGVAVELRAAAASALPQGA